MWQLTDRGRADQNADLAGDERAVDARLTRSVAGQTLSVMVDVPLLRWLGLSTWCLALVDTAFVAFARCAGIRWEGPTGK